MGADQSTGEHEGGQIFIHVPDLQVFAGQNYKGTVYVNNITTFRAFSLKMQLIGHERTAFSIVNKQASAYGPPEPHSFRGEEPIINSEWSLQDFKH
jgi:hypothetical protein